MNKTAFLIGILLLAGFVLSAQVRLYGTLVNGLGRGVPMASIEYWNEDHWQQTANAQVDSNKFDVTLAQAQAGQYRIRMFGEAKVWSEFIVPDSSFGEMEIRFDLNSAKMNGGPAQTIESKANELYAGLIEAYNARNNTGATEQEIRALNQRCIEIVLKYRKTLLGDIALLLYEPQKEDYNRNASVGKLTANEFAKQYALSKVPFEHAQILHHNALLKALNRYFNYFEQNDKGTAEYIDGIMSRRNGNETVDGFVFRYLLDKMMDQKNDPGLSYLLKWYAPDCPDEEPQPDHIQNLVGALKTCAPGNLAPDLSFNGLDGQLYNLGKVCAQNKLTLVLFWRSNCPHCKEFEPVLLEIYKKYHPLGVEVYALSSDKTEEAWRSFLQNQPTPWVNVFIPKDKRTEIGRQFPAPSTPALISLDKDRRVVNRVVLRSNLEAYLDAELAKRP